MWPFFFPGSKNGTLLLEAWDIAPQTRLKHGLPNCCRKHPGFEGPRAELKGSGAALQSYSKLSQGLLRVVLSFEVFLLGRLSTTRLNQMNPQTSPRNGQWLFRWSNEEPGATMKLCRIFSSLWKSPFEPSLKASPISPQSFRQTTPLPKSPSYPLTNLFGSEGSPTKVDYSKKLVP